MIITDATKNEIRSVQGRLAGAKAAKWVAGEAANKKQTTLTIEPAGLGACVDESRHYTWTCADKLLHIQFPYSAQDTKPPFFKQDETSMSGAHARTRWPRADIEHYANQHRQTDPAGVHMRTLRMPF